MSKALQEVVIPKEQAVFRLDGNGNWCNRHGRFRHKKIVDFFHAAIRKDDKGFHLCQERNGLLEKVYFPYEDTALFVFEVIDDGAQVTLVLNTGARLPLEPQRLSVAGDSLYTLHDGERVKFTERCLMKLADRLAFENDGYYLRAGGRKHRIAQCDHRDKGPKA
jgi:hypothetical protein